VSSHSWEAPLAVTPKKSKKNLVFVCQGPPTKGTVRIDRPLSATWDLAEVLWHPDSIASYQNGTYKTKATHVFVDDDRSKRKFACFATVAPLLPDYDAVMLVDDDLELSGCMYDDIFQAFHQSGLRIAQPGLTADSTHVWPVTERDASCAYRETDFVEVMCPIFNRVTLRACLPFFAEEKNGWGLESLWSMFQPIGILDTVSIRHVRPIGSAFSLVGLGYDPEAMARAFREKYDLTMPQGIVTHRVAISAGSRRAGERRIAHSTSEPRRAIGILRAGTIGPR